jgi:hypothetical protein
MRRDPHARESKVAACRVASIWTQQPRPYRNYRYVTCEPNLLLGRYKFFYLQHARSVSCKVIALA